MSRGREQRSGKGHSSPHGWSLNLTFGYKSTLNDDDPDDLSMDMFMVTLVYGWHPIIEGARRLKGD
jgi:hypothetical protein